MRYSPIRFNQHDFILPQELQTLLQKEKKNENNPVSEINEKEDSYMIEPLTESFHDILLRYIDNSKKKDADIYKNAYIDRRLFSKIRSDDRYHPSFKTITLLAISLELSTKQYESLLHAAAYSLPRNKREFIVLRYCFDQKIYDLKKINAFLFVACKKSVNTL